MYVHVRPTKQNKLYPIFTPLDLCDNEEYPHMYLLHSSVVLVLDIVVYIVSRTRSI